MVTEVEIIEQIERVLEKFPGVKDSWYSGNLGGGFRDTVAYYALREECIALGNYIYGSDHPRSRQLTRTLSSDTLFHLQAAEGMLRGAIEAIRYGLLAELRSQILIDIKADFLEAAQQSLDNGAKDVAAALVAFTAINWPITFYHDTTT